MLSLITNESLNAVTTLYAQSTQLAFNMFMRTIEGHLTLKVCSKLTFWNQEYNQKAKFFQWCLKHKELKGGFEKTYNGYLAHNGFYCKRLDAKTYMFIVNKPQRTADGSGYTDETVATVYLVGKNHKRYCDRIKLYVTEPLKEETTSNPSIYEASSHGKDFVARNTRTIDTIFSPQKKEILKFIQNWSKLETLYDTYELVHKTGILLHGEPGTGKTSFAKALANKCGRDIILVDLGVALDKIKSTLRNVSNAVVLFEDIDCFIGSRDQKDSFDKNKFNFLLSVLDGVYSTNDCIYIATTNYVDRIDTAFKRPGRFNLVIEVTNLTRKEATEMCVHYKVDTTILDTLSFPVNPSLLQNILLEKRVEKLIGTKEAKRVAFSTNKEAFKSKACSDVESEQESSIQLLSISNPPLVQPENLAKALA